MATKMEYTGNDVTEAIKNACAQLNVPQEQLNIEIKSVGSAGIFGLCKRKAKILVSLKKEEKKGPAPRRARRPEAAPAPPSAQPQESASEGPAPDLQAVTEGARQDLNRLLELMGMPSRIEGERQDNKIVLRISGDHLDDIIGTEGQTLDNLQYVLRKMVSKKYPAQVTVSLDAGNYREVRTKELEELALKLAQEVKETGRTRSIPALNPAERRIVHMALQDDAAIRSRSVGDGLFKKILIYVPGKGRKRSTRSGRSKAPE